MSHIFLSYASADKDFAKRVAEALKNAGREGWMDQARILLGGDYRAAIDNAIREARALVVIITPESSQSPYVTYEWSFAIGAGVPVLPVLRAPAELHPRLEPIQWYDMTGERLDWSGLVRKISAALTPGPRRKARDLVHSKQVMYATFQLDRRGKPIREGREYKMTLATRHVPAGTKRVNYEIVDDETVTDPKWSVSWDKVNFEDELSLYGDVFLTAKGTDASGTKWRTQSKLSAALRVGHKGAKMSPAIRKALEDIERN